MKTIIASSASFTAVLASYFSIHPLVDTFTNMLTGGETATHTAVFCPTDGGVMNRDFREEGVVSRIKTQSIKTSIFVSVDEDKTVSE